MASTIKSKDLNLTDAAYIKKCIKNKWTNGLARLLIEKPELFDRLPLQELNNILSCSRSIRPKTEFLKGVFYLADVFENLARRGHVPQEVRSRRINRDYGKYDTHYNRGESTAHCLVNDSIWFYKKEKNGKEVEMPKDAAILKLLSMPNINEILIMQDKVTGASVVDVLSLESPAVCESFISLSNAENLLLNSIYPNTNKNKTLGFVDKAPLTAIMTMLSFPNADKLLKQTDKYGDSVIGELLAPSMQNREEDIPTHQMKVKALAVLGKVKKAEEELTRLIFSHLGDLRVFGTKGSRNYHGTLGDKIIELTLSGKREYPNLNILYEALVKYTKLETEVIERLIHYIKNADTNVEKASPARCITYSQNIEYSGNESTRKEALTILNTVFKKAQNLSDALELFPLVMEFKDSKIPITKNDKIYILCSENPKKALAESITARIKRVFTAEVKSDEGKLSLSKDDFIINVFSYLKRYNGNAKELLKNVVKLYMEGGTKAFREFKFNGHQLANEQLGSLVMIKEKLMSLDSTAVQYMSSGMVYAESFETVMMNYRQHKYKLTNVLKTLADEMELHESELAKLANSTTDKQLASLINQKIQKQ